MNYIVEALMACPWSHPILVLIQVFGDGDSAHVVEVSILGNGENSQYVSGPYSRRRQGRQCRKNQDRVSHEPDLSSPAVGLCLTSMESRPGNQ